jgi:hypothetical protein
VGAGRSVGQEPFGRSACVCTREDELLTGKYVWAVIMNLKGTRARFKSLPNPSVSLVEMSCSGR